MYKTFTSRSNLLKGAPLTLIVEITIKLYKVFYPIKYLWYRPSSYETDDNEFQSNFLKFKHSFTMRHERMASRLLVW